MSRRQHLFDAVVWVGTTVFLAIGLGRSADAATASADPYVTECGSCHVAYPAKLLPAGDWARVFARLDRHFGVDASLDADTLAQVARRLGVRVGDAGGTAPLPRITTTRWFLGEHDELAAGTFRSPAVKSAANCAACHPGAERGQFDEHAVRLPAGVARTQTSGEEHEHEHEHED